MMRPFLPPPIESLGLATDAETQRRLEARRNYDAGYQAGLARGLEEGRAEGHREGLATGQHQGQAEAESVAEAREREGVAALRHALGELAAARAEDRASLDREARAALAALLRLVAPALADHTMGARLEALLAEAMQRRGQDQVTLRAHPETLAALPEGETPPALSLLPDPAMRKGVAEASWQHGGLVFDAEDLLARALAVLAPAASHPSEA